MNCRDALYLAAFTMCLSSAGCKPVPPTYVALREQEFAAWQKRSLEGTVSGIEIWECALCPKMRAYRSGGAFSGSCSASTTSHPE